MKIVKNTAKKLFAIVALAALTLCGVAQGVINNAYDINAKNITTVDSTTLYRLLHATGQKDIPHITDSSGNQHLEILLSVSPKKLKWVLNSITENNVHKINIDCLKTLIDLDKETAHYLMELITEQNLLLINPILIQSILQSTPKAAHTLAKKITGKNIDKIHSHIPYYIMKDTRKTIATICQTITSKNIHTVDHHSIFSLTLAAYNPFESREQKQIALDSTETIIKQITTDNLVKINPYSISYLAQVSKQGSQSIAQQITQDTIIHLNPLTIYYLLKSDPKNAVVIFKAINKSNLAQIPSRSLELLLNTCNQTTWQLLPWPKSTLLAGITQQDIDQLASSINQDNFISLWQQAEILAKKSPKLAQSLNEWIKKSDVKPIDNPLVDCFLLAPQKLVNRVGILKMQKNSIKNNKNKGLSEQLFTTDYKSITTTFTQRLQNNPKLSTTLLHVIAREQQEQKKGRYTIAHSRNSSRFLLDQVFLHLYSIYLNMQIDATSWYPLHWRLPGQSCPYEKVKGIVQNGRLEFQERSFMQFCSNLFGTKRGSSALDYIFRNDNAGNIGRNAMTVSQLFDLFGWQSYYKIGQEKFDQAIQLADQMEYGTLLLYSLTSQGLENFVYTTSTSGGKLEEISIKDTFPTSNTKNVLDTLIQTPQKISSHDYEHVLIVCDDHPTDKLKLGTQNPFNSDIRTYHFNMGDDIKIAAQIKLLIEQAFDKIRAAMVEGGILTQELADSLHNSSTAQIPKSRL